MPEADDPEVVENFVESGRLIRIPARRSPRLAAPRWLVEDFHPAGDIPEAEVNRISS